MSVNAMSHKCVYYLFLNSKRLIEFLIPNDKEFQNVLLRKQKDLLRLLMLVAVEAIFAPPCGGAFSSQGGHCKIQITHFAYKICLSSP